ncbi:MAG: D-2-hydroxyacid dehydrogenase [Nitrospinota bacterium]|nr:D-2-hydroxyacid dehydrogenase [Nitrospinota bacterium]
MIEKILVYLTHPHVEAWNFKPRHKDILARRFPQMEVIICLNSRDFLDRLTEADGVLVWYFKKEWMEKSRRLKLIATPAAGADWIDVEPTGDLKIWFGVFHGTMMAESVLGAVCYFLKAFGLSRDMQKKRKWARVKISQRFRSLYRARVTILGFGKIGCTIGGFLKPFGCTITGVKRTAIPAPDYFNGEDRIVLSAKLPEVLPETDHLILVLPGGSETQGLLTQEHFRMLPPTCYFYNVGRGNVYKETDLIEALRNGNIAGAYLDVFETEPLAEDSSLWEMENVLIQPHLSAASPQYLELFVRELIERFEKENSIAQGL